VAGAAPGVLLLLSEADGALSRSDWSGGRFLWPRPWTATEGDGGKAIALGRQLGTTWWVQKRGADLVLGRWAAGAEAPVETRFAGIGEKVAKAAWAGGERLLVQESFARGLALVDRAEDQARLRRLPHLAKVELDQVRLLGTPDAPQPALIADGVLQLLDGELTARDQVLLGDGLHAADAVEAGGALWLLERGGERLHRMAPDAGGVPRRADHALLPGGTRLIADEVLGTLLLGEATVAAIDAGMPLAAVAGGSADAVDLPLGTATAEPAFDRLFAVDLDGRPGEELIACDDGRHLVAAFAVGADGQALTRLAAWPVYENRAYPYGGDDEKNPREAEPRVLAAGDLDGDGARDLLLLIHDRLLVYLGRVPRSTP
jgi:hypothetical protein